MKLKAKHIVLILLAAVGLSFGFYHLLCGVYKDIVEIDVYAKSFKNADVQLFYNDAAPSFEVDRSSKQLLIASQFYKGVPFLVSSIAETKYMRLDLGDYANTIEIQKIELVMKRIGRKDTFKVWRGAEMNKLFKTMNSCDIEAQSYTYMRFKLGSDDPYLVLNQTIFDELQHYNKHNEQNNLPLVFSAILLSLFVLTTILYLIPFLSWKGWKHFVQREYFLIGGASAIIFIVFFNNSLELIPDMKNKEQRKLSIKPVLTKDNFFEYPDFYTDYAKDNFSFRNLLFYGHSLYKAKLFNESPLPKDVLMGKDGWFFDNEIGDINDVRNLCQVPQEELAVITQNMLQKQRWLKARGIKFYVLVAPNKHRIYPEMLPRGYFQTEGIGQNRLDLYKQHLRIHAKTFIIDPTDSLLQAKHRQEVYYKTDTHWNLFGGLKGYQVLMKEIAKDFPQVQPLDEGLFLLQNFTTSEGDLAKMVALQDDYTRKEYAFIPIDTANIHFALPTRSDIKIEYHNNKTVNNTTLKLLMFRDSYANYLIPFLNLHFKEATYVWSYEFMDKLIEEQKPDIVIFETLERFMPTAFITPNPVAIQ